MKVYFTIGQNGLPYGFAGKHPTPDAAKQDVEKFSLNGLTGYDVLWVTTEVWEHIDHGRTDT